MPTKFQPDHLCRRIRSAGRNPGLIVALASLSVAAGAGLPSVASAATVNFANPSPIVTPDYPAPAVPYPSPIDVSGMAGPVQDVQATIKSVRHTCERDLSILLVGPDGGQTILMSSSGSCAGGSEAPDETLTFDQEAAAPVPCTEAIPVPSGSYRPTRNSCAPLPPAPENFPPPAPPGPYPVTLSGFNGSNPNGQWRLFVRDESGSDIGTIAAGWSLTITTPTEIPPVPIPTNAFSFGKLKRSKENGTATLTVEVPGPGSLALTGKGLVAANSTVSAAGMVKLRIRAKGSKKRKLNRTGEAKVRLTIAYTPTGGTPSSKSKSLVLKKRLHTGSP